MAYSHNIFRACAVFVLTLFAVACALATVAANGLYGFTVRDSITIAVMLAAADLLKVTLPFTLAAARRAKAWARYIIACMLIASLSVVSIIALRGLLVAPMAAMTQTSANHSQLLADTRATLAATTERLKADGWARPIGQVEADIQAERRDVRWSETSGCSKDVTGQRRSFCAQADRLTGELAAAKRAAELRGDEAKLRERIAKLQGSTIAANADLAVLLRWFPGVFKSMEDVADLLTIAMALLIEAASVFGPSLLALPIADLRRQPANAAASSAPASKQQATAAPTPPKRLQPKAFPPPSATKSTSANVLTFRRPPASSAGAPGGDTTASLGNLAVAREANEIAPPVVSTTVQDVNAEATPEEAAHIDAFVVSMLVADDAASITGAALREAYEQHCSTASLATLDRNRFGILMSRRFEKQKQRGVMVYFGIRAANAPSTSAA